MESAIHRPILCPKIIGRDLECAALATLLEKKEGQSHITLIAGEAGIGKSRMVSEVKALATVQGFLAIQGACFPADPTYPYAPLLDLLRSLVASKPQTSLSAAVEALACDIFPLLPELVSNQTALPPHLEPEQEKGRLFAILATFFLHLATQAPLLLVIEDVHWSDDTSLDFLHYLMRHSESRPLLLLVTYRPEEMRPALSNWLTQLNRERLAHEIRLSPLARSEVDMMLATIFEEPHTSIDMFRFLHGELLNTLYTLTEGNPFFVEETLSSLITAGHIFYVQGYWNRKAGSEIPIPRSLQDTVQRRTARVSEAAVQVLTLAAVAGRHFDFALLQQLTQYDEQQLLSLMKELVSAQLVIEESAERFAFRHALTRQAIYNQLLARERRILHQTIAETIEQLPSVVPDQRVEELAYHFYQAQDWQKALAYARRAGEKAQQLYSQQAAVDYFNWALEAVDHLLLAPLPELYHERGQAYETLGDFEQAQHNYNQALDAARKIHDRVAEWQSAIDLGFLWVGRNYAQAELWFRCALDLAQALDDPSLYAHSLNRIGNWHLNAEQPHEALHYHREALATFQQLNDSHGIAQTLDLLGMASYLGGDLIEGTAYYKQAITLFRDLEDKPGLISSLATLALRGPTYQTDALEAAANLGEACHDAEQAARMAQETGRRADEAYALLQVGLCLGSQGEYARALEATRQSLQIAEKIDHRQWQTAALSILGGMYAGMCAYSQAREYSERALALARETGSLFWIRITTGYVASIAIAQHDLIEAEKLLHTALSPDTPAETMAQRMIWCACLELALAQGDAPRALEISEQLVASTIQPPGKQSCLRVLSLHGETLVALQKTEEARAALVAARDLAIVLGVRPRQWRICSTLGNLYHSQGKNTEAEQEFATARSLVEELATTIPDQPLRNNFLQHALGILPRTRPLSSKQMTKQAYGGLTAREREIAALIGRGKFNREIAVDLVLSERTVETHVSNIMLKLHLSSRRQIASWANEKGLNADL